MTRIRDISISMILVILMATVVTGLSGCDADTTPDQSTSTLPQSPAQQMDDTSGMDTSFPPISEQDLEKAAIAHKAIAGINQNLQQSVQQTENMDERRELQIKANENMVRAAENAGLDFETYNRIMHQVRTNTQMEMLFQEKLESLE